jgi:hypothetical protein
MDPALTDYIKRLNDHLEEGDSDAIERESTALARAVVHAQTIVGRWSVAKTIEPDEAHDLLRDLAYLVRGVL